MNVFKKLVQLSLINTLALLSACGGGSDEVQDQPVTAKQLQSMTEFSFYSGKPIQNNWYKFNYKNGRLIRVDFFNEKGVDKRWNTADDHLYGYSTCEFSGKINQSLRDPEVEFIWPRNPFGESVSDEILSANLGIAHLRYSSLCALNYQKDQSFKEYEFKLTGNDNYAPFLFNQWQANIKQGKILNTEFTTSLINQTANNKKTYQYVADNYIADLLNNNLFEYIKQNGRLNTVKQYFYEGTPEVAIANLNRQFYVGSTGYMYQGTQIRMCHTSHDEAGNASYINTYEDKELVQADTYAAGADKTACTSDDVLVNRVIYQYQ